MDYKTGIEEIDKQLDERFAVLSPTVRQLLTGAAIPQLAETLAKKFGLDDEMQSGIENEIALVLMYMEPVDDFGATLMSEYFIAPEIALEIEKEITARLFTPIMSELGKNSELTSDAPSAVPEKQIPVVPVTAIPPSPSPPLPPPSPPVVMPTPVIVPSTPLAAPASVPAMRVMPKNEAELPSSLLHSLRSTLAHDAPTLAPYQDVPTPKAAYNSILETKPTTTPNPPAPPQQ